MQKILIVDDEEINRGILGGGLASLYEIKESSNGSDAIEILKSDKTICAVLLDLYMPKMTGFDVLRELKKLKILNKLPVFIVTGSDNNEELLEAYNLGAVDVITKPFNIHFLKRRIENTIELYTQRNNLAKMVVDKTQELIRQNNRLVEAMANVVEFRNNESGLHIKRVSGFTRILMQALVSEYEEFNYLKDDIDSIAFASCLHDIGKIGIPDSILTKPGRLTQEEFDEMKLHTVYGYEHIKDLEDIMDNKLYKYSLDIVYHHHERYDGRGYPEHLSGDKITIWSQVVALADVYDALTSERCYKKAYSNEVAIKMILEGQCGIFNPKVIAVFDKYKDECNEYRISLGKDDDSKYPI